MKNTRFFNKFSKMNFKKSMMASLWIGLLFFAFSGLNAQCPGISSSEPVTIGNVGSCTPESGMMQWDGTTLQVYDGSSWINIPASGGGGSSPWLPNANGVHYDESNGANVGIGTNTPTSPLHISKDLSVNEASAQRIDFENISTSGRAFGLDIKSRTKTTSGGQIGVRSEVLTDYNGFSGRAHSRLSQSDSYSHKKYLIGIFGQSDPTSIPTSFNGISYLNGGFFALGTTSPDPSITLNNSSTYWVSGLYAKLQGNINNTPVNGAVAAIIGKDLNEGTAQSWAGYFLGKGHFSNKVAIGTTNIPTTAGTLDVSNFNLFVTGGILTEEVVIRLESDWADYVFAPDYDLKSLEEVEAIIEKEGHLHNTPSAQDIEDNGLEVSTMMVNQQEKIEELFLHLIDMKKDMDALKAENVALKAEVKDLQR